MIKGKQQKQQIQLVVHNTPNQLNVLNSNKWLWKVKRSAQIRHKQSNKNIIVDIINDQLAYSHQQHHHSRLKKEKPNGIPIVNKPLTKVISNKILFESLNSNCTKTDLLYNESILQSIQRAHKIRLLYRQGKLNPQKSARRPAHDKHAGSKNQNRRWLHLKAIFPKEQLFRNVKLRKDTLSLPKLCKVAHQIDKQAKQTDFEFAPWQFASSKQYFIKWKECNE